MDIDIDPNEDGDDYGYQVSDARFYLVFSVKKTQLATARKTIAALRVGDEGVIGRIGSGERVWICRNSGSYSIAIGDTDSKDMCYKISKAELNELINAEPS